MFFKAKIILIKPFELNTRSAKNRIKKCYNDKRKNENIYEEFFKLFFNLPPNLNLTRSIIYSWL